MGRPDFERMLRKAIDDLPERFRSALVNVAIVVEDRPPRWLLEELRNNFV